MQLELLKKEGDSRLILVVGEDHTLTNLLRVELNEDVSVRAASCTVDHPLTGNPKFFIRTEGKTPERVLVNAAERIVGKLEEVKKQLQRALKEK
jgi:DNA-directed RNA polymerase subunit L